MNTESGQATWH